MEEPNMEEVSEVMRELRLAAGSRGKLADKLGVSDSTAQGWERFGRLPEAVNLARIIRAFPELGQRLVEAIAPDYDETAAASAPLEDSGWLDPLWERRQVPRRAADDPPSERGTAAG